VLESLDRDASAFKGLPRFPSPFAAGKATPLSDFISLILVFIDFPVQSTFKYKNISPTHSNVFKYALIPLNSRCFTSSSSEK
jgi:hypothetical protein